MIIDKLTSVLKLYVVVPATTHGFSCEHECHEIGPDPSSSDHSCNQHSCIGPPTSAPLAPIPGPIAGKKCHGFK